MKYILKVFKTKIEIFKKNDGNYNVYNTKLGEGGFGSVFDVPIEYIGNETYNDGKNFELNPVKDKSAVIKIYSNSLNKQQLKDIKDNLLYIKNNKTCVNYFIPTILIEENNNNYLIMKKADTVNLWTDTDNKLNQIIKVNACLEQNFIISKRLFIDFKYPNLGMYNDKIIFLDTEDFANPNITTLASVYGLEVDNEKKLERIKYAHEKKIIIWIFFLYITYKCKIYIKKNGENGGFMHIMGLKNEDFKKLNVIESPLFNVKYDSINQNITNVSKQFNTKYKYNNTNNDFHPMYFVFIDILKSNNDTFNQYRKYLGDTFIPYIQKNTKSSNILVKWKDYLLLESDEDITIKNMDKYICSQNILLSAASNVNIYKKIVYIFVIILIVILVLFLVKKLINFIKISI